MADLIPVDAAITQHADAIMSNVQYTCGEAIGGGETGYLKASDGKIWKGITSAAASAAIKGIVLQPTTAADQPVSLQVGGTCDLGVACADGQFYVASDTGGGIKPETDLGAGEFATLIGCGDGTNLRMKLWATGLDHA